MELRDYQQRAIDELRQALGTGKRRPVVQSPTGSGKTVIAAAIVNMARNKGKRVLFCVPAISLIDQTVERFRQNGIFEIGVMQGQHEMTDYEQPVQVCSVQTLARRTIPAADLVIIDECFAAGTLISTPDKNDGVIKIQDVRPGDYVYNAIGVGRVQSVSVKKRPVGSIILSNGEMLRVTHDHPFFTERGWVKAGELDGGEILFSKKALRNLWELDAPQNLAQRSNRKRSPVERENVLLHRMWRESGSKFLASQKIAGSYKKLRELWGQFSATALTQWQNVVGNRMGEAKILLDILREEIEEPYAFRANPPESLVEIEGNRPQTCINGGKWQRAYGATKSFVGDFGRWMVSRVCGENRNEKGFWLSNMLQIGFSKSRINDRDRSGWSFACWRKKTTRQEERSIFGDIRVECVSFDECSGDELVYNLHVTGHPSYFAEGVLVHNCHVMFKLYEDWMNRPEWKKVPFIGLTATPWAKGMGASGRWDHLIIGSTLQELIDLGHLSSFRVFAPAHPDLTGVKTVAGDFDLKGLGHAMDKKALVADIVTTWLERGQNRSTICFAVNRVHAKHIQEQFKASGVEAEYMDAYTSLDDRQAIIRRFEAGEVKIICNVGVLTTGFDSDVRCIILARPTKSEILYVQMIGRGLRTAGGKSDCLVLDHSDTTIRLGFVTDIGTSKLHDGTANRQTTEKTAPLPKECPSCAFLKPPKLRKCPSCGFEPVAKPDVENQDGELYELTPAKKVKLDTFSMFEKQQWYSQLTLHANLRGYKPGWAYWAYKDKFKVGPDSSLSSKPAPFVSYEVQNWITARNIRKAKQKDKAA